MYSYTATKTHLDENLMFYLHETTNCILYKTDHGMLFFSIDCNNNQVACKTVIIIHYYSIKAMAIIVTKINLRRIFFIDIFFVLPHTEIIC